MFGEEAIFGQAQINIDSKGRIFLPSFTSKEAGDELVLVYDDTLGVYEIYSASALKDKFNELEEKIINARTKKDEVFYKKRLLLLGKSILKRSKVDGQGRMSIGKVFGDESQLLTTGAYNRLIIEPIKKK